MSDCVLCGWSFDPTEQPWWTVRDGMPEMVPLRWDDSGPREVKLSEKITPEAVRACATVTHWARAHPGQLASLIGPFRMVRVG